MLKYKIKNKKAEVGLTMTWIIATIIIVISISFFIFFADLLAKQSSIKSTINKIGISEDFDFSEWFKEKTILAFSLNTNNDEVIGLWIKGEENE
jgi:hypothetical protein